MAAPIRHTCPNIDKTLKRVSNIDSYVNDILHELSSIETELEELRSDNSLLRDWGYECENRISELENEIEDLQDQLANSNLK